MKLEHFDEEEEILQLTFSSCFDIMHSCNNIQKESDNTKMHTTTDTTQLTAAEYEEISSMWKIIERKWNVDIEDISAQTTWGAEIVKEVTFKDKPDSKPLQIRLDWDSVMWAEDGTELSAFETEKNVAEQIDYMIEYNASEDAI